MALSSPWAKPRVGVELDDGVSHGLNRIEPVRIRLHVDHRYAAAQVDENLPTAVRGYTKDLSCVLFRLHDCGDLTVWSVGSKVPERRSYW